MKADVRRTQQMLGGYVLARPRLTVPPARTKAAVRSSANGVGHVTSTRHRLVQCQAESELAKTTQVAELGEDAAVFSAKAQTRQQWTRFFIVLGAVSIILVRKLQRLVSSSAPLCLASRLSGPSSPATVESIIGYKRLACVEE